MCGMFDERPKIKVRISPALFSTLWLGKKLLSERLEGIRGLYRRFFKYLFIRYVIQTNIITEMHMHKRKLHT